MNRIVHWLNVLRGQENKGRVCRIRRKGFALRFYPSGLSVQLWQFPGLMGIEEDFIGGYLRKGGVDDRCWCECGAHDLSHGLRGW